MTRWYPFRELDSVMQDGHRQPAIGPSTGRSASVHAADCWAFQEGCDERDLALAASVDVPVLVESDASDLRQALAHLIHRKSSRQDRPWLLLPAAPRGRASDAPPFPLAWWLQQADGGTLCIDDVTSLTRLQLAHLLTALETPTAMGTNGMPRHARVIAGAPRDLLATVTRGDFPDRLFYRLNVIRIVCGRVTEVSDTPSSSL